MEARDQLNVCLRVKWTVACLLTALLSTGASVALEAAVPEKTSNSHATGTASAAANPWTYGWTHGVDKVFRDRQDRPFRSSSGSTLKVALAANEYEGVQLVLRSTRTLAGVRVTVSDLMAEGGWRIPASEIEVLPVGYVNTKKPGYAVDYLGWWPDPLLNFLAAFELQPRVWQPVWLDVHAPPGQAAGTYAGTVNVTAREAPPLEVPLEVTVWDFTVPREHHFPLAVSMYDAPSLGTRNYGGLDYDLLRQVYGIYSKDAGEMDKFVAYCSGAPLETVGRGDARRLVDIRQKCHDLVLAHHLIPNQLYRSSPPRIAEVKRWQAAGTRWFNILYIPNRSGGVSGYGPGWKEKILTDLNQYLPRLKDEGLLEMAYLYGFDEVGQGDFAEMKAFLGEIKRRWPTIPLMTTARDTSFGLETGLDPFVDIWVPLTPLFANPRASEGMAMARQRGRQVWWYVCCDPNPPHANLFIEQPAAAPRLLMGFMAHKFGAQGFLHWTMNFWGAPGEVKSAAGTVKKSFFVPFREPITLGPLTGHDGRSFGTTNGDGLIFYPGPNGPLPSIRMKCLRDGLEDFEYLWLLQDTLRQARAGGRRVPGGWIGRAEKALVVAPTLVDTLTKYASDGAALLAARQAIAKLLVEAKAGQTR